MNQRKQEIFPAVIVDTSFPNSLDGIAYFTPAQLHDDLALAKVDRNMPVYVDHIKLAYGKKVTGELASMVRKSVKVLQQGRRITSEQIQR